MRLFAGAKSKLPLRRRESERSDCRGSGNFLTHGRELVRRVSFSTTSQSFPPDADGAGEEGNREAGESEGGEKGPRSAAGAAAG